MGILIPTLAAMAMPARASTGFILPILIGGDFAAVGYWRRQVSWPRLIRVLPWTVLGVVAGYFLMGVLSDAVFKPLLGAMIIAIVVLDLVRRAAKVDLRTDSPIIAAVIGILAGAFTMIANAAGPVMTVYLLSMGLTKEEFLGTGAWFYLLINLFKLPFSIAMGLVSWSTLTEQNSPSFRGADPPLTPATPCLRSGKRALTRPRRRPCCIIQNPCSRPRSSIPT